MAVAADGLPLPVPAHPPSPSVGPGAEWDRRFSERPWPVDPDPLLVEQAEHLRVGRALDVASGPGRNGLWLARRGWAVTLLDASAVALDQAAARARADGVAVQTLLADVEAWEPADACFDLVVVANLHPGPVGLAAVLAKAADALVPGGHLFVVGHDLANLGRDGPPDPERLLTVPRLAAAFPARVVVEWVARRDRNRAARHDKDHRPAHPGAVDGRPPDRPSTVAPPGGGPDWAVAAWATKPGPGTIGIQPARNA